MSAIAKPVARAAASAVGAALPWEDPGGGGAPIPAIPSAPTIAESVFGTITWSAVAGATSYKLVRDGALVAGSPTSPYTRVAADIGATINVIAHNAGGDSVPSNTLPGSARALDWNSYSPSFYTRDSFDRVATALDQSGNSRTGITPVDGSTPTTDGAYRPALAQNASRDGLHDVFSFENRLFGTGPTAYYGTAFRSPAYGQNQPLTVMGIMTFARLNAYMADRLALDALIGNDTHLFYGWGGGAELTFSGLTEPSGVGDALTPGSWLFWQFVDNGASSQMRVWDPVGNAWFGTGLDANGWKYGSTGARNPNGFTFGSDGQNPPTTFSNSLGSRFIVVDGVVSNGDCDKWMSYLQWWETSAPALAPTVIACVGDSSVYGSSDSEGGWRAETFGYIRAHKGNVIGVGPYGNRVQGFSRGLGGDSAFAARNSEWASIAALLASENPSIIIDGFGINDAGNNRTDTQLTADRVWLAQQYRIACPSALIFFLSAIEPGALASGAWGTNRGIIPLSNAAMPAALAALGDSKLFWIDIGSPTQNTTDYIHPTGPRAGSGYSSMAAIIGPAIVAQMP